MDGEETPSQTIGPFFAILMPLGGNELVPADRPGALRIEGQVLDGAGQPVSDAIVEIWQANAGGRYAHPADDREILLEAGFTGFGRCQTGGDGRYWFLTVKPGPVPAANGEGLQAPHINVSVFARGLLRRLVTRIYFPDEEEANAEDPVLSAIRDPAVRATLIAQPLGPGRLRFDIRLQGEGETAFLAL